MVDSIDRTAFAPDTTVEQAEDIAAQVRHAVTGSVEHVGRE